MKKTLLLIMILLNTIVISSCKMPTRFEYDNNKVNIVVTTTIISDITKNLGGNLVNVYPIMGFGVDPHSYIGRPSDTSALKQADLIIYNGHNLEANLTSIITSFNENKVLSIGDAIDADALIINNEGAIDPHIWFDLDNFMVAIESITNQLIETDPANTNYYLNNYNNYLNEFNLVVSNIKNELLDLPIEKRILITAHDSFAYFGRALDFQIYAIQGLSTATEASPRDIQTLANLVVNNQLKAIFTESSIPYHTIQSVINAVQIQGWTVEIGGELYSDSLGSNDLTNTYLKVLSYNANTIISSLK